MTAYDDWKTTKQEIDDEAWNEAVGQVAYELNGRTDDLEEFVSIVANADEALRFLCGAITIPDQHVHAFRDLVKVAQNYRLQVEAEMKKNRMIADED